MDRDERALILSDGSLASAVACAAASEASALAGRKDRPAIMAWMSQHTPGLAARRKAVDAQTDLFGLDQLPPPEQLASVKALGEAECIDLLRATYAAAHAGCVVVVWPIHCVTNEGAVDLDGVARTVDRSLLVARLVGLDAREHGHPGLRVEVPYVDLTDIQLADLAFEFAVPLRGCWWSTGGGSDAAAERARWTKALRAVGWRSEPAPITPAHAPNATRSASTASVPTRVAGKP